MSEVVADECIIQTKNTPINEPLSRAREGVFDILEIDSDSDGNNIIFCDEDGKKIAIITYYLKPLWNDLICYVSFFWTQNGTNELYTKLKFLDNPTGDKNPLAYNVMNQFIDIYCRRENVQRIYLDADIGKKNFWKDKMGWYLMKNKKISRSYSQWSEVCYVL